ncbi:nucleoside deaminase [Adhaeribacter pallidiroseus]|uniref:tRNA(Adenine(34)) deaminase n=1 Tax=Adhaeribacter pallidiroseus TaxID=2072847 RepID=A0A369QGF1_9BACT|nr:nucleoside deaminase [Adhaeribacter pallidiroseus]RDC63794.1 tRNA(adenine(34)) deaminase [Adhaeribacter pallidiroseus]
MEEHEKWMHWCLNLAQQALQQGDFPVGAVVVQKGKLIGQGVEAGQLKKDITCHAEMEAIRDARQTINTADLQNCILYSTHEPCIMCSYVIRHHKISRVVVGTTVPEVGGSSSAYPLLSAPDISIWVAPPHLVTGVLAEACQALSQAYKQKFKK